MEKQTVDVIIGKKVEEGEAKGDAGKHREVGGLAVPKPGGAEVGGRSGMVYVRCPWDYAINYVFEDDYTFLWYRCWHCGGLFKV